MASASTQQEEMSVHLEGESAINSTMDIYTPSKAHKIVKALVKKDIRTILHVLFKFGLRTPRHTIYFPIKYRHDKCLQLLIQYGGDVNEPVLCDHGQRDTPLRITAKSGYYKGMLILLESGAHVESGARDGREPTALHYSSACGYINCVQLLIEHNAFVNAQDGDKRTPLHEAVDGGHMGCIELLAKSSANINAMDANKRTPLHLASMNGTINSVKLLLRFGADFSRVDTNGKTALELSTVYIQEELNSFLNPVNIGCKECIHRECIGEDTLVIKYRKKCAEHNKMTEDYMKVVSALQDKQRNKVGVDETLQGIEITIPRDARLINEAHLPKETRALLKRIEKNRDYIISRVQSQCVIDEMWGRKDLKQKHKEELDVQPNLRTEIAKANYLLDLIRVEKPNYLKALKKALENTRQGYLVKRLT